MPQDNILNQLKQQTVIQAFRSNDKRLQFLLLTYIYDLYQKSLLPTSFAIPAPRFIHCPQFIFYKIRNKVSNTTIRMLLTSEIEIEIYRLRATRGSRFARFVFWKTGRKIRADSELEDREYWVAAAGRRRIRMAVVATVEWVGRL